MTPSFADLLMADKSFNNKLMPKLRKILFCGERLTEKTVLRLNERFGNLQIINSYGPTECTFAVTSTIVKPNDEISVGIPKDDVDIYIVNDNLNILEDKEIGEILITGKSVGKGYLNELLNKNAFITFNDKRAYLTGDLGYKKNNQIYCIGRKDKQIKFKGYRIELLEIENTLNKLDYIEKAYVTTLKQDDNSVKRIIAFVKLNSDLYTNKDIKKHIETLLPSYMIPTIKVVNTIPLTENGKVNENILLGVNNERKNN